MRYFKFFITFSLSLAMTFSFAQENNENPAVDSVSPYSVYLGTSSGINNMNGLLGGFLEIQANNKITCTGGLGLGLWGIKGSVYLKYYNAYPRGFYFGAGYSFHSGYKGFSFDRNAISDDHGTDEEIVEIDFLPQSTINLIIGRQWSFTHDGKFRFHIEGGYAIPFSHNPYEIVTDGYQNDESVKNFMRIISPGGLIFGCGVSAGF